MSNISMDKEGFLALKNYLLKCVSEKEASAFQAPKNKKINNNSNDDNEDYYDMACEARGQVSYALQFEESAGLLPAADAYTTAFKLLQSAIVLCTDDDSNTAVLQQFSNLVAKRIEMIQKAKESKQQKNVQLEEKKKKTPSARKWAKHYKDSKNSKKVNRTQTLRSIKQVSYGAVSKKVVSHFQAYSLENLEHADVRKIKAREMDCVLTMKYSTIRVHQPHAMGVGISSSADPAFTVWFSSHNKNYKLSIETLHCYSATLRTILISASAIAQQEEYIELIKRAFKIDLPTHESLLLAVQKEFQASGPTAVAAKELEMRLKFMDDHQFYSKHSFRSKEDFEIWRSQEQDQIKKLMNHLGISETEKNHHPQRTQQHKHVLDIFGSNDEIAPVIPIEPKPQSSGNNNNNVKDPKNNKLPLDYHKCYLLLASNLIKYDSNHAHEIALRENPPSIIKKDKKKKNEPSASPPPKGLPKSRSELDMVTLPTEIAPLSEMSKWVLEHFAELYGIGKIYTKIVYFDILCQSFNHTMHHMTLIANTIQEISQLLSMRNLVKLTKQEIELLQTSIDILFAHIQQRVETFQTCFPMEAASSKTKSSNQKSLELFKFMTDKVLVSLMALDKTIGDQYEGILIQSTVKELMVNSVKKKVEKDFHYMVLRADRILETEHKESVIGSVNEDKLLMLLDFIVEEIAAHIEPYLPLFEQHCKFGQIIVTDFYEHFFNDLFRFCQVANQNTSMKLTPDFFEMINKTREFTSLCLKAVPQLPQHDLSACFEPFIVRWITETHVRLEQWTMEAYDLDKLEIVDKTQPYSSSVIDLFCLITSPLQVLKDVLDLQTDDRFVQIYSVIIHKLVEKYVDKVYTACVQDIPLEAVMQLNTFVDSISKSIAQRTPILRKKNTSQVIKENLRRFSIGFTRAFNPSSPSNNNNSNVSAKDQIRKEIDKQMCILANNVEASRIMLEDVDTEFQHNFGEYLGTTFEYLKGCSHKMLGSMIYRMNFFIRPQIVKIVDMKTYQQFKLACKEKHTQCMVEDLPAVRDLFDYLDAQLELCSDNFLPTNFIRILKLLWETDIVEMITPNDPSLGLSPEQALILEELIEPLILFFNANDCGLQLKFLEEGSCAFIRSLVGLIEVDTEALILLYKALIEQPILKRDRRADLVFTSNHILNLLATRKDKEAQAFVKQELKRQDQK